MEKKISKGIIALFFFLLLWVGSMIFGVVRFMLFEYFPPHELVFELAPFLILCVIFICCAIFMLQLKHWARRSIIVIASIIIFFSACGVYSHKLGSAPCKSLSSESYKFMNGITEFLHADPPGKDGEQNCLVRERVIPLPTFLVYFLLPGIVPIIFLTRHKVKEQFH